MLQDDLEITSDVAELPRLREFLREFCRKYIDFNDDDLSELELAVNEAAANIMKHAYKGRTDQPIRVEAESDSGTVTIRLLHHGASFSPEKVKPPSFDGSRDNGFGVYLIAQCVDEVRYILDEQGRNCTCMRKRFTL